MKYIFLLLLALFLCVDLSGQALDALPTIDNPQPSDRIDTYTRGFPAAFRLDTLRKYFAADIVEGIATSPYTSVHDSLRGRYFASTSDSLYYADYYGGFVNLTGGSGGGNWVESSGDVYRSSGAVGIGTSSPAARLNLYSSSSGVSNFLKFNNPASSNYAFAGGIDILESSGNFGDASNYGARIYYDGSANLLKFQTANQTTVNSSLTIKRDGVRVGIGTDNPSYELDVSGTARATSFIGNGSGLTNIPNTGAAGGILSGTYPNPGIATNVGTSLGNYNIMVGVSNMGSATGGSYNLGIGVQNLQYLNSSGGYSLAIGFQNLRFTTSGRYNFALGNQNLYRNTTGSSSFANGYRNLYENTTGQYNFANGSENLYSSTSSNYSFGAGYQNLYDLTSGSSNIALGYRNGFNITSGSNNFFAGYENAKFSTEAESSFVQGIRAGPNSTGDNTVNYSFIQGDQAMYNATEADSVVVIGRNAGYENSYKKVILIGSGANALEDGHVVLGSGAYVERFTVGDLNFEANTAPNINDGFRWDGTQFIPDVNRNIYSTDGTISAGRVAQSYDIPGGTNGRTNLYFARPGNSGTYHTGFEAEGNNETGFKLDHRVNGSGTTVSSSLQLMTGAHKSTFGGDTWYYDNGNQYFGWKWSGVYPQFRVGPTSALDFPNALPSFDNVRLNWDKDGSVRFKTDTYEAYAIRNTTLSSQSWATDTDLTLTVPGGNYTVEATLVFEGNNVLSDFIYRLAASGSINTNDGNGYVSLHTDAVETIDYGSTFGETVRTTTADKRFQVTLKGTIKFYAAGGTVAVQRAILDNSSGKTCTFLEGSELVLTPQYGN